MKRKSKGAGIMISDFVDSKNGFLAITEAEYENVKETDPGSAMHEHFWSMVKLRKVIGT